MEEEYLQQRTPTARIIDAAVDAIGSMPSLLVHLAVFSGWILINLGLVPGMKPFDPFPFILLIMFVSMESVMLALFVLMKQNRMSRRADQREHLHLQINLLAEKEITAVLQLQQELAKYLNVPGTSENHELQQMAKETAVENLARELKDKLPGA